MATETRARRPGSCGYRHSLLLQTQEAVGRHGRPVDNETLTHHASKVGVSQTPALHVLLGGLAVHEASAQAQREIHVETLAAEPVRRMEVAQVSERLGMQAGLLPQLLGGELDLRTRGRLPP